MRKTTFCVVASLLVFLQLQCQTRSTSKNTDETPKVPPSSSEARTKLGDHEEEKFPTGKNLELDIYMSLGAPELQKEKYKLELFLPGAKSTLPIFYTTDDNLVHPNHSYLFKLAFENKMSEPLSVLGSKLAFRISVPIFGHLKGFPITGVAFQVKNAGKFNCDPIQTHDWKPNKDGGRSVLDVEVACLEETFFNNTRKFVSDKVDLIKIVSTQRELITGVVGVQAVKGAALAAGMAAGTTIAVPAGTVIGLTIAAGFTLYKFKPYVGDTIEQALFGPYLDGPNPNYSSDDFKKENLSTPYVKCRYYPQGFHGAPGREVWVSKNDLSPEVQNSASFYNLPYWGDYLVAPGRWVIRYDEKKNRAVSFATIIAPSVIEEACRMALVKAKLIDGVFTGHPELAKKIVPIVTNSSHLGTENTYPLFFYMQSSENPDLYSLLVDDHMNKNSQKIYAPQDWFQIFKNSLAGNLVGASVYGLAGDSLGVLRGTAVKIPATKGLQAAFASSSVITVQKSYEQFKKIFGSYLIGRAVANLLYPEQVLNEKAPQFIDESDFHYKSQTKIHEYNCIIGGVRQNITKRSHSFKAAVMQANGTNLLLTDEDYFQLLHNCLPSPALPEDVEKVQLVSKDGQIVFYRYVDGKGLAGVNRTGLQLIAATDWESVETKYREEVETNNRTVQGYFPPLYYDKANPIVVK